MNPIEIIKLLRKERFILSTEKDIQHQIELFLAKNNISFFREVRLNSNNIIDFLIDGTGIEVKIKGRKREIYKQICRYAEFYQIKDIILLTTMSMNLPEQINNKPVTIINFSRAWL